MDAIKAYWKQVLLAGAYLLGVMGTLLVSPDLFEDTGELSKMSRFVVIGILSLFWVPMLMFKSPRHMWRWWVMSAFCLVAAAASYAVAFYQLDMHSVPYTNSRTVTGDKLLPEMEKAIKEKYGFIPPIRILVEDGGGATDALFPVQELKHYRYIIILWYLATALFTSLFILSSAQAFVSKHGK